MAKFVKFSLTANNELVYRNTGQYYTKKYTIKGYTVYGSNGRKIGTVGKPTAKQKKRIETAKKNREKRMRQQVKKFGGTPTGTTVGYRDLADAGEMAVYGDVPLSRYQQELVNFSIMVRECVDAGYMTDAEAQSFINRWMGARSNAERNAIWNDVKKFFKDKGYHYN